MTASRNTLFQGPAAQGLYSPANEHDACGLAFVATLTGKQERHIVDQALVALENLDHRGAVGAEANTGDGAGLLTQIPDTFMRAILDFELPPPGRYAVGTAFLPQTEDDANRIAGRIEKIADQEGLSVLGWRAVPTDSHMIGPTARSTMPIFRQLVVSDAKGVRSGIDLDRLTYRLLKRALREQDVFFASLSSRTLVYKGMLTTSQLPEFFPDLVDPRFASAIALVHSRFSTNTFPSWPLAQPFSMIAHNGEINTVGGNRNWQSAREQQMESDLLGDLEPLRPICSPGESDSASFNSVLELLHLAGRELPHAVLMMLPEAWENNKNMDPARRDFYAYHSTMMEAWDGPACVSFSDGTLIGAVLDRNGLRPGRFWITDDGLVVLASESGVLDLDERHVIQKGRLEPGKMFLVDTAAGRVVEDEEIKNRLAAREPYGEWVEDQLVRLDRLPPREHIAHSPASVSRRQQVFGYTQEELKILLSPMASTGAEPLGAMGNDAPIAVLSKRPRLVFDYFAQLFAQVTNPPLDAIREELVTSLGGTIGPEPNLLAEVPEHARKLVVPFPVIDNDDLAKIVRLDRYREPNGDFSSAIIRGLYTVNKGGQGLAERLEEICAEVDSAIEAGVSFIVLSDRESSSEMAPIPSLLLTAAVHHHLLRQRSRTRIGLVVEAGDVREVHHVALLVGYGAAAINPYLAMESVEKLARQGDLEVGPEQAVKNLIRALGKGVLKVMSKMGISTVSSYRGAQIFEAVGLSNEVISRYFTGTTSRIGGVGLDELAAEVEARHRLAYPASGNTQPHRTLPTGGDYKWRREGESHMFDPEAVFTLQQSTARGDYELFKRFTDHIDRRASELMTLRGMFALKPSGRDPIDISEVEPVSELVKRFSTGAMSYGSISSEAHESLARAMNMLGAKSNTGEGGEDSDRLHDSERRSSIKQVASGRFGVTAEYLTNADDIQIKLAQGAKPGEGGQLPGTKVYPWVARTRHSTPGVGLISPPPHHDIYSIEDLKQLIHDLKNANPRARIHVKLASEVGVGTVAAGVSKAYADVVLIAGHDGGTGASPLTSLKHAGVPWELGLAETQQTLLLNNLRDRIVVQVDGQLKTGRDVVIGAMLGAEEFGFATAPLVVLGCIMMRACHKDTCPVGIATQNPELRERFTGRPEHLVTYFEFIAQQVREYLAQMGFRSLEELVGRADLLDVDDAKRHWKAEGLDLEAILHIPANPSDSPLHNTTTQDHGLDLALDNQLIAQAGPALEHGQRVRLDSPVRNINRTVGTMLGYQVVSRYGDHGMAPGTIDVRLTGSAGQSLGAFLPQGISIRLTGDANDYVGKGLSGGTIVIAPPESSGFVAESNVIAGNVIGYGATSGQIHLRGTVGERFGVRNSGATLVVEGVGDHACEYMTGGTVAILGPTGRNLGAGMSGGRAFLLDLDLDSLNSAAASGELMLERVERPEDVEQLTSLLRSHAELTGSEVAKELLTDIPAAMDRFCLIIPRDYARMNHALTWAQEQGLDPHAPQAWKQILEVASHG